MNGQKVDPNLPVNDLSLALKLRQWSLRLAYGLLKLAS